jgi:hypothetical protein
MGAGGLLHRTHERSNTIDVALLPIIPQDLVPIRIHVTRPAPIFEGEEGFGWHSFPIVKQMKVNPVGLSHRPRSASM